MECNRLNIHLNLLKNIKIVVNSKKFYTNIELTSTIIQYTQNKTNKNMGQYFNVKVQFRIENENGKVKKETVNYLVDAQSVTEAEARTVQYLLSRDEEAFEVKSASEAKIAEVIVAVETPEAE